MLHVDSKSSIKLRHVVMANTWNMGGKQCNYELYISWKWQMRENNWIIEITRSWVQWVIISLIREAVLVLLMCLRWFSHLLKWLFPYLSPWIVPQVPSVRLIDRIASMSGCTRDGRWRKHLFLRHEVMETYLTRDDINVYIAV